MTCKATVNHHKRREMNLTAVFSVASGTSVEGSSSDRISSILRGSSGTSLWTLTFSFLHVPAVSVFHSALWDFEPGNKMNQGQRKTYTLWQTMSKSHSLSEFFFKKYIFRGTAACHWGSNLKGTALYLFTPIVFIIVPVTRCHAIFFSVYYYLKKTHYVFVCHNMQSMIPLAPIPFNNIANMTSSTCNLNVFISFIFYCTTNILLLFALT